MDKNALVTIVFALFVLFFGYSYQNALKSPECVYPNSPDSAAPDWVCEPAAEGYDIVAVGYAEKSAAGVAFMKQMAVANARNNLTGAYSNWVVAKKEQVNAEVDLPLLTDGHLINSTLLHTANSPAGGMYALVGIKQL